MINEIQDEIQFNFGMEIKLGDLIKREFLEYPINLICPNVSFFFHFLPLVSIFFRLPIHSSIPKKLIWKILYHFNVNKKKFRKKNSSILKKKFCLQEKIVCFHKLCDNIISN
jgi:hypothetical protein